jgi:hypothetical protein
MRTVNMPRVVCLPELRGESSVVGSPKHSVSLMPCVTTVTLCPGLKAIATLLEVLFLNLADLQETEL